MVKGKWHKCFGDWIDERNCANCIEGAECKKASEGKAPGRASDAMQAAKEADKK
jgi:hypothetical protein